MAAVAQHSVMRGHAPHSAGTEFRCGGQLPAEAKGLLVPVLPGSGGSTLACAAEDCSQQGFFSEHLEYISSCKGGATRADTGGRSVFV